VEVEAEAAVAEVAGVEAVAAAGAEVVHQPAAIGTLVAVEDAPAHLSAHLVTLPRPATDMALTVATATALP
jgi:hypothetical protein